MAFLLVLFVVVISASLHAVGIGLPIGQGLLHNAVVKTELKVLKEEGEVLAKRQTFSGLNHYLLAIFLNWRSLKEPQCNATYNDQLVSRSICDATLAKGNEALNSNEYDDCKGSFKVDLSATNAGPVTAVELALYKLPSGRDTKQYYAFIQYGTKMSTLNVPGSALGWQIAALQGATTEATNGKLDILIAVYTSGSGFLSCSGVKSLFTVAGNGEYSPLLAVYTNASSNNNNNNNNNTADSSKTKNNTTNHSANSNTTSSNITINSSNSSGSDGDNGGALVYDEQGENQNHSYITVMSNARSECATKPTRLCHSNVNLSFKTSNKATSLELGFTIPLGKYEKAIGAELAINLNANTQNNTYTVYVYRRISPLQFTSITSTVLPPNRAGWQIFSLETLVSGIMTNTQTNVSLLIKVAKTNPGHAQTPLSSSDVHSMFNLNTGTEYSPIVMTYVQNSNPCSYILCRRDATAGYVEIGRGEGDGARKPVGKSQRETGRGGESDCQVEDHQLDLRTIYPDVVYPRVVNVGHCASQKRSASVPNGIGSSPILQAQGVDNGSGGRCMPTRHSSLQTLHKNELSYLLLDHPDLITTECSSL